MVELEIGKATEADIGVHRAITGGARESALQLRVHVAVGERVDLELLGYICEGADLEGRRPLQLSEDHVLEVRPHDPHLPRVERGYVLEQVLDRDRPGLHVHTAVLSVSAPRCYLAVRVGEHAHRRRPGQRHHARVRDLVRGRERERVGVHYCVFVGFLGQQVLSYQSWVFICQYYSLTYLFDSKIISICPINTAKGIRWKRGIIGFNIIKSKFEISCLIVLVYLFEENNQYIII